MSSLPIKEKIVEELAQLPEECVREVYQLVQKLKLQHPGKAAFQELQKLLEHAPTWSEAELKEIKILRRKNSPLRSY